MKSYPSQICRRAKLSSSHFVNISDNNFDLLQTGTYSAFYNLLNAIRKSSQLSKIIDVNS